jgi:hypothetical protein
LPFRSECFPCSDDDFDDIAGDDLEMDLNDFFGAPVDLTAFKQGGPRHADRGSYKERGYIIFAEGITNSI